MRVAESSPGKPLRRDAGRGRAVSCIEIESHMQNEMPNDTAAHTTYTVVIPAWNESMCITQVIDAINLARESLPFDGEVIVVDNNSSDNTAELAIAKGAKVVFEAKNQIARARNCGARAATGDYLLFVDADTMVSSDLLSMALGLLKSGSVIGGGATVRFDQELTGFTRLLVRFWNWWSLRSQTAAGCFIFCTKAAFEAVGGFDEKQYVAEELYISRALRQFAKKQGKKFQIISDYPVMSSARKKQWFSTGQMIRQILVLLIPGASRNRRLCWVWYDRGGKR